MDDDQVIVTDVKTLRKALKSAFYAYVDEYDKDVNVQLVLGDFDLFLQDEIAQFIGEEAISNFERRR
ncbi:hypothetical protein G3I44_14230 [Halogeometricum borinquense]|uniref:Uncharacterized protein n=1 Tax=Halogeometricum borinquense TaxID=60847 RepID=A0A6C0UL74_9EURY|nr:hypothetical protein [Halogeometricum borinquense]QIB75343.1 hypothetical protein G3I44_14230 [Halogeometricum borinquense]